MPESYCNQFICKPSQKLQTGGTQPRLGGFYKGYISQEGQGNVPSPVYWASLLGDHKLWETWLEALTSFIFLFQPNLQMVSSRKLLSFVPILSILRIFQGNLCKRKGIFSWKAFPAFLNCAPSSRCLNYNCSALLLLREQIAHSASSEISPFSPFPSSPKISGFLMQLIFSTSETKISKPVCLQDL